MFKLKSLNLKSMKSLHRKKFNRRDFIKGSSLAAAGFIIVPRYVLGGNGFISPSDKLNIAAVGAGGRGAGVINEMYKEGLNNIVALCDVDDRQSANTYNKHPNAPKYKDFRMMLDKQKDIDAVTVAIPDHSHAVVALSAMASGKHVYVEKPLAHDVYEVRMMTEMARKNKLATQMGNQGASGAGTWQTVKWIESGVIGEITNVHCWTNRPIWPQGIPTPTEKHPIPAELDWNLWLGPSKMRDYNSGYLPFKWRGWWDFGTGALGDMACHIVDVVVRSIKLGHPDSVEASVTEQYVADFKEAIFDDSCPMACKVVFHFPDRGTGLPPVKLTWYDGGILPDRPAELGPDDPLGSWDGGVIFEGTKGKIMTECYGNNPVLLPKSLMEENAAPSDETPVKDGHYQSWVNACKGGEPAVSNFDISGPLSEIILMGNLAIRSFGIRELKPGRKYGDWAPFNYPGRKQLMWDGANMKITNFDEANQFVKREYREGWNLPV